MSSTKFNKKMWGTWILILWFVASCTPVSNADKGVSRKMKWSERMAQTLMVKYPEAWQLDDNKEKEWDYVHGLVMSAFEKLYQKTGKPAYYNYLKGYADATVDQDGNILGYKKEKYNIDMVVPANFLFSLYDSTKDRRYLTAIETIKSQLETQPRTSEGGFWHKKIYPNQMWLDGLYMGEPFYARYTTKFENGKNLNDVARQFEIIQKHLVDPKTGLLYHGWDESRQMAWSDPKRGTSPNFWSRSLGWYMMALVDVLDYFPADHPKRTELIGYLSSTAAAIAKYQDASGLWFQVTDQGNRDGNYLEASGSAMFIYAFAKGANKGYLPKNFRNLAEKGFDGMTRELIKVSPDGFVTITNVCAVAGLGGNPFRDGSFEYYVNEKRKDNDPKATGPFIMAALELNR